MLDFEDCCKARLSNRDSLEEIRRDRFVKKKVIVYRPQISEDLCTNYLHFNSALKAVFSVIENHIADDNEEESTTKQVQIRPKSGENYAEVRKTRPAQGRSALLGSQDVWYDAEASEMDDLASQQETKRIYLIQQIHNSLFDFEDRLNEHLSSRPYLDNSRPSNLERQLLYPRKTANRFRSDSQSSFRPQQMILPELGKNASHRSQRSFRKEPWSPSDESYLRTFADDSKQVEYHKDQTQRINEMLSIVEGLPSDTMKEPKWLGGRNDQPVIRSYFRPRSPSPPPYNNFDRKATEDISQARLRAVEPFPEKTLEYQPIERFSPQLRPVEQRSTPPPAVQRFQSPSLRPVERQTPTEPTEHRFKSPPLRPVSRHTPNEPSEHRFQPPPLRPVERPLPQERTPQRFESPPLRQVLRPTPKPVQQAAFSPPPPPPQQILTRIPSPPVRQEPPAPKIPELAPVPTPAPAPVPVREPPKMIIIKKTPQRMNPVPSKPELEKVNLRRAAPKATTQTNELYSHALKRTGNRSKLGVPDDDGDGTVTRVNFNVPLQVST